MRTLPHRHRKTAADSGLTTSAPALVAQKPTGFLTLGGEMVSYRAGTAALANGAAILVGDLLVGISPRFDGLD